MKLKITDLATDEVRLRMAVDPTGMPALEALHREGQVGFEHTLNLDLRAFRNRDMVTVLGQLTTRAAMDCARCLTRHLQPLDIAVELSYLQVRDSATRIQGAAVQNLELDAREAGLIRFEGEVLDLTEGLAEQVIMQLPIKPLCHPECQGLCSRCGVNLNRERCSCDRDPGGSPFAMLQHWPPKTKGD
jgi:uncharacterized protein